MRTHIVMVPGFGGFDALGQLNYYAGVTEYYGSWLEGRGADPSCGRAVMHYFENLPTAAVATRGAKLARYVKRLVARRVIQQDDEIVLIGHSTGGLDIRQMIRDLAEAAAGAGDPSTRASPNDDAGSDARRAGELLARIRRLVFLSVPQRGTNIADWVRTHRWTTRIVVGLLRRAVGLRVWVPLAPIRWVLRRLAPGHANLLDAVADARRDLRPAHADPLSLADARDAQAQIDLWLAHQDRDFFAIDDLSVHPCREARIVDTPEVDARIWKAHNIRTRSYATVAAPPFGADELRASCRDARGVAAIIRALRHDVPATDFVYRVAYSACSGGPFASDAMSFPLLGDPAKTRSIECWENDGIVNTAAMVPPDGERPFVVDGDHADIIGHFALRPHACESASGRRYDSYDLLGSNNAFDATRFELVWNDLFDFALPR